MADQQPKSERESINSERGQDSFVKSQQHYLLYKLIDILNIAEGKGHLATAFNQHPNRLKALYFRDGDANYKFSGTLARTQNSKYLRKIPPNVLSGLTPRIKVYKVIYPYRYAQKTKGTYATLTKAQTDFQYALQVPFDHASYAVSSVGYVNKDVGILESKGYLDLANLVSFNYQFIGTNPAEVEACITANMKLKFQTIDAMLEERILGTNLSFEGIPGGFTVPFKYSDLVNQGLNTAPDYYRLKVEIGYAPVTLEYIKSLLFDGGNIEPGMYDYANPSTRNFEKFAEGLTAAINDSTILMYIYPVRHDISFTENGSIEMNIDFHGAVEQIMSSKQTDVLMTGEKGRKLLEKIKDSERAKNKKIIEINTKINKREGDIDTLEREKEQIEKEYEEEVKNQTAQLSEIYQGFIDTIYSRGAVKSILYDPIKILQAEKNKKSADTIETNVRILANARRDRNEANIDPAENLGYVQEDNLYVSSRAESLKKNIGDKEKGNKADTDLDSGRLRFIFLQDIIAQAMSNLDLTELEADDFFVVLGNVTIPISKKYKEAVDTMNASGGSPYLRGLITFQQSNSYAAQFNIGTLPISLEFFNKWFFETVVKPGKKEYNIKTFLYDIIELVRISSMQMFGDQTFSIAGSRLLSSITTVDRSYGDTIRPKGIIETKDLVGKIKLTDVSKGTNIMYLFSPSILTTKINPLNIVENDEKNIFTFIVGSSAGLLKRITYKKQEIPGMREARALQEGELATGTLRMKYDADIEMYGPCLFRPGDYIVINPVFLSKQPLGNSITLLASDLGLGGIYMVLKTNTEVSRDGVSTKLDAVFQSYGTLIPLTAK